MIYLASPYSDLDVDVRNERYMKMLEVVKWFALKRELVYSPIVHWHVVADVHELPTDAAFWSFQNKGMVQKATWLIVCTLPGWDQSQGVRAELLWAREAQIKISYLNPRTKLISDTP